MPNVRVDKHRDAGPASLSSGGEICLAILDEMPIGVTVVEAPAGAFVWHNREARQILGGASIPIPSDGEDLPFLRPDGRRYQAPEFPLMRAVLDGEVVDREQMHYRTPDGRNVILEVSASRVRSQGRQFGVCTYQDVTAEYDARSGLTEAAERVQLALDAGAIVGTWVWDVPRDIITADALFARSFGLDPERCRTGLPSEEALASVHPADRVAVEVMVARTLEKGGAYQQQYRVLRHDGEYRWVEATGRVEPDDTGAPARFPGVLVDITAWKQAEEARNLLMREVDHRSRNILAMVQSLVRLTDAADPARFRDEVVGRVDAMARAQGLLARSNWKGGAMESLIREELSAYAAAHQFALGGPALVLPPEQVQPLSMIMHEMATNAVKYGALSTPAGKVTVSWEVAEDGGLDLAWRERGGPTVAQPVRKGFGSRLIERLTTQLGGRMEIAWPASGLTARLRWRA